MYGRGGTPESVGRRERTKKWRGVGDVGVGSSFVLRRARRDYGSLFLELEEVDRWI